MTSNYTAPRIYVACLASYNNGVLHGSWIDCEGKGADELTGRIWALEQRQMLNTREWLKADAKPITGTLF